MYQRFVSATAGDGLKVTKAITDVNGVYTGVQDVDIITKTSDRIVGNYYEADGTTPASAEGIAVDLVQVAGRAGVNAVHGLDVGDHVAGGVVTQLHDLVLVVAHGVDGVGNYYEADGTTPASRDHDDIHWLPAAAPYTSSSYVAENAYAVYDKNNFIIGAVILGEAEGSNATKVTLAVLESPVRTTS